MEIKKMVLMWTRESRAVDMHHPPWSHHSRARTGTSPLRSKSTSTTEGEQVPGKAASGGAARGGHSLPAQVLTQCSFPTAYVDLSLTLLALGPYRPDSALLSGVTPSRIFLILGLLPSEVLLFFIGTYSTSSKYLIDPCIPQFMPWPLPCHGSCDRW